MTGWQTTLPSLVALFAALVALTTPFIAADRADRGRWREQRRGTYDTYLATCAVRRRRLEAQARRMSAGLTPKDAEERDEARESVVADWNRVNLATGSDALRQAAEGLLIVVDDLRAQLDAGGPITEQHLESLQSRWDDHRAEYIRQARLDLNLPRP